MDKSFFNSKIVTNCISYDIQKCEENLHIYVSIMMRCRDSSELCSGVGFCDVIYPVAIKSLDPFSGA